MSEKLDYLSPEWRDEAEKKLKQELTPEKMNRVTTSMSNIYTDCPDGDDKYMLFRFEEGTLTELTIDNGEPPKAEFRIVGKHETFAMISRAELGAQKALMTRKLKLRGNMVKALKLAAVADRLNKVLSTIPTNY